MSLADQPNAWERQPYDSPASWAYFRLYLEQDPPRSVLVAYRAWRQRKGAKEAAKQAPGSWNNIAAAKTRRGDPIPGAMTWAQRAAAWDDHVASLERQKWADRRLELREKEWELGQKLIEKAQRMLMFPVVAQESADGHTIIMPAGWKFRDVPAVVSAASKIARLAAEMSTENVSIDWREEARKAGIGDPDAILRELTKRFEEHLARSHDAGSLGDGETQPSQEPE